MKAKHLFKGLILIAFLATAASAQTAGFVRHNLTVYDELGRRVTDISSIQINTGSSAQSIYQDQYLNTQITNPMTTTSDNTTLSSGSCYWYGADAYNATITSTAYGTITVKALTASDSRAILPTFWQASQSGTHTDAQSESFGTDADWVIAAGATAGLMTLTPASANSPLYLGTSAAEADVYFFGATSDANMVWDASEDTLELWDNVVLAVGVGDDWTISHNGTTTTMTGAFTIAGAVTASTDFTFDGTYDALWDDSESTFELYDNTVLGFGNTGAAPDVELSWDTDSWNWVPAAVDTKLEIGDSSASSTGFDVHYYFETAGEWFTDYDGDFLCFTDDMDLRFGTGASSNGDFQISSGASNVLAFEQVVADTGTITWGANGAGIDQTWYGEEAGDYMKWDGTGATQLQIVGADSSGTLMAITGIDTTGNSDTMTIAHSGTGDGLQITCTEADSVAAHLIAATSQTTSVLNVDGATGSWVGATGVGMVSLTNDGTPAHANASLLRIAQSGTSASGQRGIAASLEDTSTAGGGTPYVLYISSTNNEAIHVDSGAVLVDETITATGGVQSGAYTATATADGLTTGLIPSGTRFCTVTSDSAAKVVVLPAAVVGNIITITVPATGAELQTLASSNATINGVDCDGANEMAMAAGSVYQLTCVAANTWIAYGWGSDGAAQATIVPDADA